MVGLGSTINKSYFTDCHVFVCIISLCTYLEIFEAGNGFIFDKAIGALQIQTV